MLRANQSSSASAREIRISRRRGAVLFEAIENRVLMSAAPPALTPEQPLPGDITPAASVGMQTNPSLSEGPNGVSLSVWQDTRSGGNPNVPFGVGLGTMTDIYAARVRADGSVIDVTPIPVSIASYNQVDPKVAWNGTDWLIAWNSPRDNDPYETDIKAVRVSPDGVVLDQQPMTIGTHLPNPQASNDLDPIGPLEIVSDGTDWVVTYRRHNPNLAGGIGMEWFATKVMANGTVPNVEGVKILTADQYSSSYGMTYSPVNGGQYLHTYDFNGVLRARRYTRDLVATGAEANAEQAFMGQRVSVAGGPNGWLFAWEHDEAGWKKVMAKRISAAGTFTDSTPIEVTLDYEYGVDVSLDAAWNGVDWVVAYSGDGDNTGAGGQDIWARRIDPVAATASALKGGLINTAPLPNHQGNPQLVGSGDGGFKLVYTDQQTTKPGIAITVVSPANVVTEQTDVSLAAPSQASSRLASDGNNFLMVFASSTAYGTRLLGQRVTPSGAAIDNEPFVIADTAVKPGSYEVVYFNGRYVALFSAAQGAQGNYIYATPVGVDGTVGQPQAVVPQADYVGFTLSDVAVNGDRIILVGNSREGGLHISRRFFRIFDTNFQPLTDRIQLSAAYNLSGDTEPVNGGWIATWNQKSTHDAPRASVVYAKINLDGTIAKTGGVATSYPGNGTPTVVSNGGEAATEAMIMYTQNRDPINPAINDENAIRAMRIAADGTALSDQLNLIDEPGTQSQPAAIFDGTNYVVTWTDQRHYLFPAQNRDDIFAARVAVDGTVIDVGGFAVADNFRPETHGDVGVAGGKVMFAYNSFRHEAPWGSYRLVTRGMDPEVGPPLAITATPAFDYDRDQAVKFQFNKPIMGIDTADVVVQNTTTGQTIPASAFTLDVIPANTQGWQYRWKFVGFGSTRVMPDGFYTATLKAGSVTDFAGRPTTSDIVVNFRVLAGDADGNGVINFDDYSRIDAGFNQKLIGFSNGDFDYNGVVNFDDYALIDAAFGRQQSAGTRPAPVELPPAKGKLNGGRLTV